MPYPSALPALAAIVVLGVTAGVQLGRAAAEEIPARYFASPEGTRSFAALSPNPSPEIVEPTWAASHAYEGYGLGAGCVGCGTYPEEYRPIHDPAVDGYDDGYSASALAPAEAPEFQYAAEEDEPESASAETDMDAIQLYAHFPVTMDEAEGLSADADRPVTDPW